MTVAFFDLDRTLRRRARFPTGLAGPPLRRHARPLLEAHRRCGHRIVLLTSSPNRIAPEMMRDLGACSILPMPPAALRPRLIQSFLHRLGCSAQTCYAYASHPTDRHWLNLIGHPIATSPTWRLRRHAATRSWKVIDLDSALLPP